MILLYFLDFNDVAEFAAVLRPAPPSPIRGRRERRASGEHNLHPESGILKSDAVILCILPPSALKKDGDDVILWVKGPPEGPAGSPSAKNHTPFVLTRK